MNLNGLLILATVMVFLPAIGACNHAQPDPRDSSESLSRQDPQSNIPSAEAPVQQTQPPDSHERLATTVETSFPITSELPSGHVNADACASCHQSQYDSYLKSHHSRSLTVLSEEDWKRTGEFVHEPSQTRMAAIQAGGSLNHQLSYFRTASSVQETIVGNELPVGLVMGSGAFAKAYLLKDGDYLIQSPLTWYAKPDAFGIAPGYEGPQHAGLTRVINENCLGCHAGLVSRVKENDEQLAIHVMSIHCERCHGAAQSHCESMAKRAVAVPASSAVATGESVDSQIVHPGKLDRLASESICSQCHLQGDALAPIANRSFFDYRPGQRFEQTRMVFKVSADSAPAKDSHATPTKTFVDHFDQLWHSECYLQSEQMTCVTCHDPHHDGPQDKAAQINLFNQQCLSCHQDQACGKPLEQRVAQNNNTCFQCHMPRLDSEVPHTATTNHRIAVYGDHSPPAPLPEWEFMVGEVGFRWLRSPFTADQSSHEREYLLAAAMWMADRAGSPAVDAVKTTELQDLLQRVQTLTKATASDVYAHAAAARLAKLIAERDPAMSKSIFPIAAQHAQAVLRLQTDSTDLRKQALDVLAAESYDRGDYSASVAYGAHLTRMRRQSQDWYNYGLALGRLQRFDEAEVAFRESIRQDNVFVSPYRSLAKLYSFLNPVAAQEVTALLNEMEAYHREIEAKSAQAVKTAR